MAASLNIFTDWHGNFFLSYFWSLYVLLFHDKELVKYRRYKFYVFNHTNNLNGSNLCNIPVLAGEGKILKILLETWIVMLKQNFLNYLPQIKNHEREPHYR